MRLIDADAIIEWIDENVSEYTPYALVTKAIVISALKSKNVAPTVGEWVSVKDRLPEKNGDYITYDRDGTVWPHFFTASSKVWEDALGFSTELVTHWMPLPEPPKEG